MVDPAPSSPASSDPDDQITGWNSIFMENHDQPRGINHFGNADPKLRNKSAKMLAIWQLTLRGPYVSRMRDDG